MKKVSIRSTVGTFGTLLLCACSQVLAQVPTVRIGTPADNSTILPNTSFKVNVTARDPDGVESVRLWTRKNGIDQPDPMLDNAAPFELIHPGLAAGSYQLYAKSKDRNGNTLDSSLIDITVVAPFAKIVSPAPNATFKQGDTVIVRAEAANPAGIDSARLWSGTTTFLALSEDEASPFEFSVENLAVGQHELFVKTKDRSGNFLDSTKVKISVTAVNQPPTTKITSPSANAAFNVGTAVPITASATDADGTVAAVRFWIDDEFYSLDDTAPYTASVAGLEPGTHKLVARAKDSGDNITISAPVMITIAQPLSARITAPLANARLNRGEPFVVQVEGYGVNGIEAARLWIDDVQVALDNVAPFSFSVDNLLVGTHKLEIRLKDYAVPNNTIVSSPVSITVVEPSAVASAAITAPASASTYTTGQSITVTTKVFDADGIQSVALYVNNALQGTDTTAPFGFTMEPRNAGTYALKIITTDKSAGAFKLSSAVSNITVVAPSPAPTPAVVNLPLEVLGPKGTAKELVFNLTSVAGITHLYLQCNACGYHDIQRDKNATTPKATVSVNGLTAISLNHFIEDSKEYGNAGIQIVGDGEADYGGIGGAFRTVRFKVPVPLGQLKVGENRIKFTHANPDMQSLGFRIIDFNLVSGTGFVFSDDKVVLDDPTKWITPLPADVNTGKTLWNQRGILVDEWVNTIKSSPVGTKIKASCADCHAIDGRDLKYFNFSNDSIIARSVFHKLSELQGRQIASYIRSIDIPVVKLARPWNPPYQPGLGVDSKPVYEWAAGAGIDKVLNNDSDMKAFLFPDTTSAGVKSVVNRFATLNMRQLPVNIPMPEWSQWLPIIHPSDAFKTDFYSASYNAAQDDTSAAGLEKLSEGIKNAVSAGANCSRDGNASGDKWRYLDGVFGQLSLPTPINTNNGCSENWRPQLINVERAKRGLSAWASVKLWEIVHSTNNADTKTDTLRNLELRGRSFTKTVCPPGSACLDGNEHFGWLAGGRNLFDRPPHFTAVGANRSYFHQNELQGIIETASWYHLQLILNTGYRRTMPAHFAYTYSHVELMQQYSNNVPQSFRFWATMIKQRQLQTNGKYGVEEGMDLRTSQPHIYYGTARGKTSTKTQSGVGATLWKDLTTHMIEDFVADAKNTTGPVWRAATQNRTAQNLDAGPFKACSGVCEFKIDQFQGDNTYKAIGKFRTEVGVPEATLVKLIDWGKSVWAKGGWDNLRQ